MKLRFKLGNVEIEELGIKLGGVEIETEFSLEETAGVYELQKRAIKELPEILTDLKTGANKFQELDKEFREEQSCQVNGIIADIDGMLRRIVDESQTDSTNRLLRDTLANAFRK